MIRFFVFLLLISSPLMFFTGCETPGSTSTHRSSPQKAPTRMVMPENPVSSIAQREIVRRQERIRSADEAALRAGQQSASGDLEGARAEYSRALDTLPE